MATTDELKKAERLAEVKGASAVKERLGTWNEKINNDTVVVDEKTKEERLAELKKADSVKSRLNNWQNKDKDLTVTSDPEKVAERVAEAKASTVGIKDRTKDWDAVANKKEEFVRKDPIKIPDSEPSLDEARTGKK